jgi:hypothetical protein
MEAMIMAYMDRISLTKEAAMAVLDPTNDEISLERKADMVVDFVFTIVDNSKEGTLAYRVLEKLIEETLFKYGLLNRHVVKNKIFYGD